MKQRAFTSKLAALLLALLAAACGGNYSNEDLEFQAALPVQEEITAAFPQALSQERTAEYYKLSRAVTGILTAMADGLLGLIDAIRSHPPTSREQDVRIWGPFRDEKKPGWETRLVISRKPGAVPQAAPTEFSYALEVRRLGGGAFIPLVVGRYSPSGGARVGEGEVVLDVRSARAQSYPLEDLEDLATFSVVYQTRVAPTTATIDYTGVEENGLTPKARYERQGAAGSILFEGPVDQPTLFVQAMRLQGRWLATGEGRGDLRILAGAATGRRGVDCWDRGALRTFVTRDWDAAAAEGDESRCVFGAPETP